MAAAVAGRAPTIIVSAGRKGGAGKTTTALNLAGALAETCARVLLIDLDPQASLTRLLLAEEATGLHGIGERMMVPALGVVDLIRPVLDGIDLLPGDRSIETAARTYAENPVGALRLRKLLADLDYDFIILDTPPILGFALSSALITAQLAVLPTFVTQADFDALSDTIALRDELDEALGAARLVAILPNSTRHDGQDVAGLAALRARYGDLVGTPVPHAVAVKRAINRPRSLPVVVSEPASTAAAAYRDLAQRVIKEAGYGR
jgi:chromosome partitioning protein